MRCCNPRYRRTDILSTEFPSRVVDKKRSEPLPFFYRNSGHSGKAFAKVAERPSIPADRYDLDHNSIGFLQIFDAFDVGARGVRKRNHRPQSGIWVSIEFENELLHEK